MGSSTDNVEKYIKTVVLESEGTIAHWMGDYLAQMLVELLEEEIVVQRVVSSVVHSPTPDKKGVVEIRCECFDDDGAYIASAMWRYNHASSDPTALQWELDEIILEDR